MRFPESYVALLRAAYDHVEDIDLYVGGSLESFNTMDQNLFGSTFECITNVHYKHVVAGDAYFYTHRNSPYPFSSEQIRTIQNYKFEQLICSMSDVKSVPRMWYVAPGPQNPMVPCRNFKRFDLTAWSNIY